MVHAGLNLAEHVQTVFGFYDRGLFVLLLFVLC